MKPVLAAVLALSMTACSFAGMDRLRSGHRVEATPRCQSGRGPVYVDATWTAVFVALTALGVYQTATSDADTEDERTGRRNATLTFGAFGAVIGSSTYYGWRQSSRCAKAQDAHDRFLRDRGDPPALSAPEAR